ncbi:MAG: DUF1015 domain-containing protein [Acidimicrobiales bacterium]|jgi:uncharacterized protein (DUF1015 family)
MARLEPFAAIRYDDSRVELDDVVSPPYDVVGPAERAQLVARSPYNAINIELPAPDAERGLDAYANAERIHRSWIESGILLKDPAPALYVYRTAFRDEHGQPRVMTGLLGALGLDLDNAGQVLPHEQTIPKDRKDRLTLLRSTRINTSPIWGLSLAKGLSLLCTQAIGAATASFRAFDSGGALHELWPVTDSQRLAEITALVAGAPILIADGHHRYDTACTYAGECRERNGNQPGPHDLVLAFVVELSEDELFVGAIHRLVKGVPADRLVELLAPFFRVEAAPDDLAALPDSAPPGVIGIFTGSGFKFLYPLERLEQAAEDDLDSSRLKVALDSLPACEITFQPGWQEAVAAVRVRRADAAFLLRPVSVARIERVAYDGRRMAPKSTFFLPKPLTGLAFRSLDD